jgi:hypothetical protein
MRYRRFFNRGERNRVNRNAGGTHEFNYSIKAGQKRRFWQSHRNVLSPRGGSMEHFVNVAVIINGKRQIVRGRVWDRIPNAKHLGHESRFRPFDKATGVRLYGKRKIPNSAMVVIDESKKSGVDYEYEIILRRDPRYAAVRIPGHVREVYS